MKKNHRLDVHGNNRPVVMPYKNGRVCCRCDVFKPWTDFYNKRGATGEHTSACRACLKVDKAKARKASNLKDQKRRALNADWAEGRDKVNPLPWKKHTPSYWSILFFRHRLDFWPSTGKFKYMGEVIKGDAVTFMESKIREGDKPWE